ncbi:MAG: ATP-dependent DNA helicase RecG [Candidatus Kapabacteria bacterium]|nr:ATP-dependent DNA helicase RecG [Candidatus Kapabacteria bacterium]
MSDNKEKNYTSLQYLKGVGPKRAEALASAGILIPEDLLFYFPRAYIDRAVISSIRQLSVSLRTEKDVFFNNIPNLKSENTLIARIINIQEKQYGKNRKMLICNIQDETAGAKIIFWNRIEYYSRSFKEGDLVAISGKPELDIKGTITFHHPELTKLDESEEVDFSKGILLPIYPLTEKMKSSGINNKALRTIIKSVLPLYLDNIKETLPEYILKSNKLPSIKDTISLLHFPENISQTNLANYRLKYEEIFFYEMFVNLIKSNFKQRYSGLSFNVKSQLARKLVDKLPFKLTDDQKKVIREIADDLSSGKPMNRLLQGDVGSGKTIVSLIIMLIAIENGYQVALMAPTEVLAEQHFRTISKFIDLISTDLKIILLTSGLKASSKKQNISEIEAGKANIVIGTHSLFENEIKYKNLGFIVIDEQQRFGVAQRANLINMASDSLSDSNTIPHILVMTATPIPRTLTMTLYGDLDVSIIREMPKNRKPVITKIIFESQINSVYDFLREQVNNGEQAFIVYPLVEKSEKLELKAATEHFKYLSEKIFPELSIGLIHGQMSWTEKESIMLDFLEKKYQILVSTTVIEVGIDIPDSNIMVIENAERFGLSQLHQLRGRIGRGDRQGYCFLVTKDNFKYQMARKGIKEDDQLAAIIRLKTMERTTDGFEISEVDMKLRGPGDILGLKQSGVPDFKYINIVQDGDIISKAKNQAISILGGDPHLRFTENNIIKDKILKMFKNSENYLRIG